LTLHAILSEVYSQKYNHIDNYIYGCFMLIFDIFKNSSLINVQTSIAQSILQWFLFHCDIIAFTSFTLHEIKQCPVCLFFVCLFFCLNANLIKFRMVVISANLKSWCCNLWIMKLLWLSHSRISMSAYRKCWLTIQWFPEIRIRFFFAAHNHPVLTESIFYQFYLSMCNLITSTWINWIFLVQLNM
jgi:hypothetical protein